MTLLEFQTAQELKTFVESNPVCVVAFSAHWCGPCKASRPGLEELARDSKKVPVSLVHEDDNDIGDYLHTFRVRAFPTYVLFASGTEAERVEGANLPGLKAMIERHEAKAGPSMPSSGGNTLGGSHSEADARALRLARLGGGGGPAEAAATAAEAQPETKEEQAVPMETEDSKPAAEETEAVAPQNSNSASNSNSDEPKQSPVDSLDPEALRNLTEEMGFSLVRAQKGLLYSSGNTVESAIEWLMEHQDDADIDDPIPEDPSGGGGSGAGSGAPKAVSYKCNATGKIFATLADLELHANRTGHTDFEESTETVKPRTPEEKAAKILELKALLKKKRAEREEAEKVDHTEREKQRRFMGKEMAQTREQMEAEQRKRDARARKKEKIEFKKERERIRAELEKDKRERMANKGKLKGRLGVDGYAPSAIQYENGSGEEPAAQRPKTSGAGAARIDECISKVASYRAGGDGGKCLKVLGLLVGNAADHPEEEKFKSINMETKTYKNKVKPFVGAKSLLLAVGFGLPEKNNDGTHLVLREDADLELLKATKAKLQEALAKYG